MKLEKRSIAKVDLVRPMAKKKDLAKKAGKKPRHASDSKEEEFIPLPERPKTVSYP